MEKRQEKETWAQRLCENDPDLKCPQHDRMSFVLANKKAVAMLLDEADVFSSPDIESVSIKSVYLEYPITKGSATYKSIVGFADAAVFVAVSVTVKDKDTNKDIHINDRMVVVVEAKPKIENPMETLRQLRTYRIFLADNFPNRQIFTMIWCPTINTATQNIFTAQCVSVAKTPIEKLESLGHWDENPTFGENPS